MNLDYYGIGLYALAEPEDLIERAQLVAYAFDALGFDDTWKKDGETVRRRIVHRLVFARWRYQQERIGLCRLADRRCSMGLELTASSEPKLTGADPIGVDEGAI